MVNMKNSSPKKSVGRLSVDLGSYSSILQTKKYHIIILDINIIRVSALSMDAMVVQPAYLPYIV